MKTISSPSVSSPKSLCKPSSFAAAALCLGAFATVTAQAPRDPYAGDPPNRVARVAYFQGNVSLEPAGTDSFGAAEINYPLSIGDRVYTDLDALSELQSSGLAVRLGNGADFTITSLTDGIAQFALAQGSIRLVTRDLYAPPAPDGSPESAEVEVDTPNTTVMVRQQGDIRVDFYPQDSSTVVTVGYGEVEVSGPGFDQILGQGRSIHLSGIGQVYPQWVQAQPPDALDSFDSQREQQRNNSVAFRDHYVDPGMIGAGDLDQYGDWQPSGQYGPVWFPRNVGYGWTPYSVGHWANVAPWGYTWVDSEPWGFAPFHYGRWNDFNGRWGWIPGPPPSVFRGPGWNGPTPRPVYSPALVAFVGGGNGFSLSLNFGGGNGGGGVTAWFPLGPSEPYVPWYHSSPAYVNRVNVTNVYNTNVTEIHNTYINKTTTVYNTSNVNYINRNTATVAVNQNDFAAGHSVARSQVQLTPTTRAQLVAAPVLTHALATPPRVAAPLPVVARAVPASVARPVVQTRQGFQRAGAPPASAPLRAPVAPEPSARAGSLAPRAPQVINPQPINAQPIAPVRSGNFTQPQPTRAPAQMPAAVPAPVVRQGFERPEIERQEIERQQPERQQVENPSRTPVPARPVAPIPEAPPRPATSPSVPVPATLPYARPTPKLTQPVAIPTPPAKEPLTPPRPTTTTIAPKKPAPMPPVDVKNPRPKDENDKRDKEENPR